MVVPAGSTIVVRSEANGITTQPVEVTVDTFSKFVSVNVDFEPVVEGMLRIEATVAFDRLFDGFFLQTAVPTAVASRLVVTRDGEIQDFADRMTIGSYSPNQPFRIRMDIDMSIRRWSVSVDNEIDGFEDDVIVSGLRFINDPNTVPRIGEFLASLDVFPTVSAGATSVAYDDITIATAARHDHFKCYLARGERSRSQHVFLEDQFESGDSKIRGPVSFCNPVDKNGEGINDPDARLVCYRLVNRKGDQDLGRHELLVENQFGDDTLHIRRAQVLCVPSTEIEVDGPGNFDRDTP